MNRLYRFALIGSIITLITILLAPAAFASNYIAPHSGSGSTSNPYSSQVAHNTTTLLYAGSTLLTTPDHQYGVIVDLRVYRHSHYEQNLFGDVDTVTISFQHSEVCIRKGMYGIKCDSVSLQMVRTMVSTLVTTYDCSVDCAPYTHTSGYYAFQWQVPGSLFHNNFTSPKFRGFIRNLVVVVHGHTIRASTINWSGWWIQHDHVTE